MKKKILLIAIVCAMLIAIFAMMNIVFATNEENKITEPVITQEVGETENWNYNFELPKYDEEGKIITYELDEEELPQYYKTVQGNTVVNTLKKYNYRIEYYYNGLIDENATITGANYYGTIIDKYDDKSKKDYRLDKEEGLGLKIGENEEENVIRIYYVQEVTSLDGTKIWKDDNNSQGLRPSQYCLKLYANGEFVQEKWFTEENWNFDNLLQYNYQTGEEIVYTVQEDEIILENGDKYVPTIKGTQVINTLTGTTVIEAKKVWEDLENQNNTRPDHITYIIKKVISK